MVRHRFRWIVALLALLLSGCSEPPQKEIDQAQAAIDAGIPQEVPAITINKVCLSGLNAIALADQLIRAGEVEVVVSALEVLNPAAPLPFPIDEHVEVGEEARLKYRYLDLRRSGPAAAIRLRSRVNKAARDALAAAYAWLR